MVQKHLSRFGFVARGHLDLAQKLAEGRERFDRVILDKKIESRERYMKMLPRLCKQVDQLRDNIEQQYTHLLKASRKDAKKSKVFEKSVASLQRLYPRFYFKQKVTEEFVHLADEFYRSLLHLKGDPGKKPRTPNDPPLPLNIQEIEKTCWLTSDEFTT